MARRDLPTPQEALRILSEKRTRPPRRPPPPLGRALNKTLREFDARFGQGSGALEARWREVVGAEIAKRTEPVKLTRGRNGGHPPLLVLVACSPPGLFPHPPHVCMERGVLYILAQSGVNTLAA